MGKAAAVGMRMLLREGLETVERDWRSQAGWRSRQQQQQGAWWCCEEGNNSKKGDRRRSNR